MLYTNEIRQEPRLSNIFGVVDLFAGPGGLGEGFLSLDVRGQRPFRIGFSIEKEQSAHETLTLRAFLRQYRIRHGKLPRAFVEFHAGRIVRPDWSKVDADAWRAACMETHCVELGTEAGSRAVARAVARLDRECSDTVLIGGPPCQAYSLVGRARAKGKIGYKPEEDERHYLFREYIRVLDQLQPAAFVMENVKGMLSSTVESRRIFEMLMEDLRSVGGRKKSLYELRAVRVSEGRARLVEPSQPSDFVVRAEDFGVPQRRHRVIIVGIRSDLASGIDGASIDVLRSQRTVHLAIGSMPRIRSGVSRGGDDPEEWRSLVLKAARKLAVEYSHGDERDLRDSFRDLAGRVSEASSLSRSSARLYKSYGHAEDRLLQWLERPELEALAQHESRGHMGADLARYMFAAVFGEARKFSPKADDFPSMLAPEHRNWHTGIFADRFRVQLKHEPSTTVTSHISKDGHYFIHYDAAQCRSLTVREAARLQTFPDDYLFLGNRTQQYVQVGNAVPPYLARQIAELIHRALVNGGRARKRAWPCGTQK